MLLSYKHASLLWRGIKADFLYWIYFLGGNKRNKAAMKFKTSGKFYKTFSSFAFTVGHNKLERLYPEAIYNLI